VPGFEDVYITPRVNEAVAVADAGADISRLTPRPAAPRGETAAWPDPGR
jgi:hypothetical protein